MIDKQLNEAYEPFFLEWKAFVYQYADARIQEKAQFVNELATYVTETKSELNPFFDAESFDKNKQKIFEHIISFHNAKPTAESFDAVHQSFIDRFSLNKAQLKETFKKEQDKNRFRLLKEDSFVLKPVKAFKILFFRISKIPFHVINLFRKKKKTLTYWSHQIPLKNLYNKCFFTDFFRLWPKIDSLIFQNFASALNEVKNYEKFYVENERESRQNLLVNQKAENCREEVKILIDNWLERQLQVFEGEIERLGTIEGSSALIRPYRMKKQRETWMSKWSTECHMWKNTIHALFEDWRSELELSALQAHVQHSTENLLLQITAWSNMLEENYLMAIKSFLGETKAQFEIDEKADSEALAKQISQINYQVKKKLNQNLLQNLQQTLSKNTLLNQLDRYEFLIEERIARLEQKYVVTQENRFDKPLADNELSAVSNAELLKFELEPKMQQKIVKIKNTLFRKVEQLIVMVDDVDEIITYMLGTVSESIRGEENEDDALQIIQDGFQRAINKVEEAESFLKASLNEASLKLHYIRMEMEGEFQELKKNENVSALKLRINKAKALRQSQVLWLRVRQKAGDFWLAEKKYEQKLIRAYNRVKEYVTRRFFAATIATEPAREVSDFLNENLAIMEGLPVIYRKLYALEPLTDPMLFEGRRNELSDFHRAYLAWQDKKYAAVLFTGEKGSGVTSLINYAIKNAKISQKVLRHRFSGNITQSGVLYAELAQLLEQKQLTDKAAIIQYLKESNRKVIILEKLHEVFLRVINGRNALTDLLEIITSTQKEVFWVCSLSTYAFQYLEKTTRISGAFSYHIPLQSMADEEISQLIIKRNRISGFRIVFEETDKALSNKAYRKLDDAGKQDFLRQKFFNELNKFANSNISMALIYWLLSTKEVNDQQITIKAFKKPDLSFISSLPMERVFVLHALIMHEGLSAEQLSSVLSVDIPRIKFLLMESLEDGLIREESGTYKVNSMVYRSTIQLLKSKNLIA